MPITAEQIAQAKAEQDIAAHDENQIIRLIAGPGTGKSHTIKERIFWLLSQGIRADDIYAVSFTRASTIDLREGIRKYCRGLGCDANNVKVSTLHSLALQILRRAHRLYYPGTPTIIDDWEVKEIYDKEFSNQTYFIGNPRRYPPTRCEEIRVDYEAFCGTGQYSPPNFIPPDPIVSNDERQDFISFHHSRNQIYSCVLPGELVKECVSQMESGSLDVVSLLGITHLIVDEYQDLNPVDLLFVDLIIRQGVKTFVAGDDDQSIYSFRLASPSGIQFFTRKERFPDASSHEITSCFRCTPNILSTAQSLISAFSEAGRLPKKTHSLYLSSDPIVNGNVFRWHFQSGDDEANAIGLSCRDLIKSGVSPNKITILLSNTIRQLGVLTTTFNNLGLDFELPREKEFVDSELGRYIYGLLRIACDHDDYFAHRLILGLYPGIGITTCNNIANKVLSNSLNYRDLFYLDIPENIFTSQQLSSINKIRRICASILGWAKEDSITSRSAEISNIVSIIFPNVEDWNLFRNIFPAETTLEEIRDYMGSRSSEQKNLYLGVIFDRLGLQKPANGFFKPKVKIMTMHGVKGLSSEIVFIPGLEESILPGSKRSKYPGLVYEAARMLYVSITRTKIACILSYSDHRFIFGHNEDQTPSRYISHLHGRFQERETCLQTSEIAEILKSLNDY